MSSTNGNGNGNGAGAPLTFAEVRRMARWLDTFTATDLADALRVTVEVADQFCVALLQHELALDTEEIMDGPSGWEPVYEMEPLPDGPNEHWTDEPPELRAAREFGLIMYDIRGLPVRIRTERQSRQGRSTPGAAQKIKQSEANYQRMQEAKQKRAEEQKAKAQKEPKWRRKKKAPKKVAA